MRMPAKVYNELAASSELPPAGVILDPGNAEQYQTGDWRSERPVWNAEACIHCLRCWVYCPEGAVRVENGRVTGIDYDHCKGCGICAHECPPKTQAIVMTSETGRSA